MNRSEVNEILLKSDAFIRSFGYIMPPFAYWSPDEMKAKTRGGSGITAHRLGWDITDYGLGKFGELGLFLFTVRNGDVKDLAHGRGMLYAEKIMISRKDQMSPMHRHNLKAEDIINRGALRCMNVFHAGDGNLHPLILFDASVPGELQRTEAFGAEILELSVALGGTITGEHGVGHEKINQMCVQFAAAERAAFHRIKYAFDPLALLNPGKAIPTLHRCAEYGRLRVSGGRVPHPDLPRF